VIGHIIEMTVKGRQLADQFTPTGSNRISNEIKVITGKCIPKVVAVRPE
jgi:hypothetical protein